MTVKRLKKILMDKAWEVIKDYFYDYRVSDSPIIQNLNYSNQTNQKKAIICYLTYSHFADWQNISSGRTQPYEILAITKILSDLGYCTDIIGCNDMKALDHVKAKRYNLIFGFGETFYELVKLQPWAVSVLYMTEQHPEFSYREEQKRVDYFNSRHSKQLKVARSGKFYKKHHFDLVYDEVIVMGETNEFLLHYKNPFTIFPSGLSNPSYEFKTKNHTCSKKHFLWMGSPGATIHKGLDLLLDIFVQREDIVLHIGGIGKEDKKTLNFPAKENIIDHGYINVRSDHFLDLVQKCSFIILPSCSEACATSVTTGMLHGLIPVVMKNAGFNRLGRSAVYLSNFELGYLNLRLDELTNLEPKELEVLSRTTYEFAKANLTLSAFDSNMRGILTNITLTHKIDTSPTKQKVIPEKALP